jgi:hypothetical protein
MSVKSSTNRFPIDSLLVLEAAGTAAVTSSAGSASNLALDVLTSYWATGDVAELRDFAVVIETTALVGTGTYTASVQVSTDPTFASPAGVAVATSLAISATGRTEMIVERDLIAAVLGANATAGYARVYMTLGGTSPSITYNAYAAPVL